MKTAEQPASASFRRSSACWSGKTERSRIRSKEQCLDLQHCIRQQLQRARELHSGRGAGKQQPTPPRCVGTHQSPRSSRTGWG